MPTVSFSRSPTLPQGVEMVGIHTSLGPRRCKRNIQRPLLPAHVLICFPEKVRLPPLLLEELHHELSTPSLLVRTLDRAHERNGALVDQSFEIYVVDSGERKIEQVARERRYRGEVAVEENCMQYGYVTSVH
jgi:hypothetical protein